jgi:stage II sporulation protein AA (anti-sigma F factor antagonist)
LQEGHPHEQSGGIARFHAGLLEIVEQAEPEGVRRVALAGELDLASAWAVERRLQETQRSAARVRLDLSDLQFIDCVGLRVLLAARAAADADGGRLEIAGELRPPVRRMLELLGERLLSPESGDRDGAGATGSAGAGRSG